MKVCLKIKDCFKVLWNANVVYLGAKHPQEISKGERKQLGLIPKLVNFPLIPFFSFSLFLLSFYLKFKIKI